MGGELNYRKQVLDEICLEGLSGITLQVTIPQKSSPASVLCSFDCLPPGALGASVRQAWLQVGSGGLCKTVYLGTCTLPATGDN